MLNKENYYIVGYCMNCHKEFIKDEIDPLNPRCPICGRKLILYFKYEK